jgi:hypothetical protein
MSRTSSIAERLRTAAYTGKEAIFFEDESTNTGTEYEFTPDGLKGYIEGQGIPSGTQAALDLKLNITDAPAIQLDRENELPGYWTSWTNGAFIHRVRDRMFIGNAVGMGNERINTNDTWVPDSTTGANWIPRDTQLSVMSDLGVIAISGGSRTSDKAGLPPGGGASIGVTGFIIQDSTVSDAAWAFYADIQHQPTVGGNSYGIEIAAKNKTSFNTSANPYDRTSGVYGIWLAGGGDGSYGGQPTHPANVGVMFVKSSNSLTSGWNVGFNFDDESLSFDGGGVASAIRMAENHAIEWYASDGRSVRIYSTIGNTANAVSQIFDDNAVVINGVNNKPIIRASHTASGVNYLTLGNAATASPPSILASGDDINVGIYIRPKGSGTLRIDDGSSNARFRMNTTGIGFFATSPVAQKTGWGAATGTATRTTFDTTTVTTEQLAQRVKALIDDLHSTAGYGLITT